MEKILIGLVLVFSTTLGYAATADKSEINCDYTVASSITTSNPPGKQPSEVSGKLTLTKEGKSAYKGSFAIDDNLKINVEATITTELNLSVKVSELRNQRQTIIASAAALFPADNGGNFAGKVFVRSAAVETIAVQNEVMFEQAPLEQLPLGNNFLGTLVSCN